METSTGTIDSVSFLSLFNIMNTASGNYYLAIRHRNSIETWSSILINYIAGNTTNFSFISSSSQAFGNNQIQVNSSPLRYAIYSGDVNQDGAVDITDLSLIDASYYGTGYLVTDIKWRWSS
ncbi:MAG: hypothetical protein IPM96_18715 [Ignavibacteria bacterium]|nr:hypothetical protein [Ignavibacteria bacterium]